MNSLCGIILKCVFGLEKDIKKLWQKNVNTSKSEEKKVGRENFVFTLEKVVSVLCCLCCQR